MADSRADYYERPNSPPPSIENLPAWDQKSLPHQQSAQIKKWNKLSRHFSFLEKAAVNIRNSVVSNMPLLSLIQQFEKLEKASYWFALIFSLLLIPLRLYQIFHALFVSDRGKISRSFTITMAASNIVLGIIGTLATLSVVLIAAPILLIAISVRSFIKNVLATTKSIYDIRKNGKRLEECKNKLKQHYSRETVLEAAELVEAKNNLYRLTNKHLHLKSELVRNIHTLIMDSIAITASFLTATPVGYPILAGLAAYGLLDTFKCNPFILLGKLVNVISTKISGAPLINLNPFAPKTKEEVIEDLQNEIQKETTLQHIPIMLKQNTPALFPPTTPPTPPLAPALSKQADEPSPQKESQIERRPTPTFLIS